MSFDSYKSRYTFIHESVENGKVTSKTIHEVPDAHTLQELLFNLTDFLRGTGFSYVDDVTATTNQDREFSGSEHIFGEDIDVQELSYTLEQFLTGMPPAGDTKKVSDKPDDILSNLFPPKKKDK